MARLGLLLESRRVPAVAALLGIALTSSSIFSGHATEDWIQRELVRLGPYRIPWVVNPFDHAEHWTRDDVVRRNVEYQLYGWFPWIADKHFDASFWRPIASLTHQIDYRAWPTHPAVMHGESVLWYGALVLAVALLYRRLVESAWVAGLAALLYAADDSHGHAVGWIINRNAVMATAFSVLALVAFDSYRRRGSRSGALLTFLCLGLGLCSAEFALCSAGYFVAYALFVDPAPPLRRAVGALPWVAAIALWTAVYRWLGHSTYGSGLYIDPLTEPIAYAFELCERATVLLLGVLGAPPSDVWTRAGSYAQGLLVFWAAMFVWFVAWALWPTFVRSARARFWGAGLLLSLPPACATFCEDRLLLFAGVGAMPLVAETLATLLGGAERPPTRRRSTAILAIAWALVHGVVAPLALPYRSLHMARYDRQLQEAGRSLFSLVKNPEESLIVVNAEDFYFAGMIPLTRVARGELNVARIVTLAGTPEDVDLRRIDEKRLEVRPRDGFLSRVFNRIYRGRAHPIPRGRTVDLLGVQITVSEVNQWGEPLAAVFEFALPLEHPRYRWVVWRGGRYEPFTPPGVGASARVHG